MNEAGNVVQKLENVESSGLTKEFEVFYFDEPMEGSVIIINLRGTTASAWNAVNEAGSLLVLNIRDLGTACKLVCKPPIGADVYCFFFLFCQGDFKRPSRV